MNAFLRHQAHDFSGYGVAHGLVDLPGCGYNSGLEAGALCLGYQVVGIDADTVTSHQAGLEGQKIPFGASGLQHIVGVNTQALENKR